MNPSRIVWRDALSQTPPGPWRLLTEMVRFPLQPARFASRSRVPGSLRMLQAILLMLPVTLVLSVPDWLLGVQAVRPELPDELTVTHLLVAALLFLGVSAVMELVFRLWLSLRIRDLAASLLLACWAGIAAYHEQLGVPLVGLVAILAGLFGVWFLFFTGRARRLRPRAPITLVVAVHTSALLFAVPWPSSTSTSGVPHELLLVVQQLLLGWALAFLRLRLGFPAAVLGQTTHVTIGAAIRLL